MLSPDYGIASTIFQPVIRLRERPKADEAEAQVCVHDLVNWSRALLKRLWTYADSTQKSSK